jgi:hypothetical protein
MSANVRSAFNAALTLTAAFLIAITPATQQYLAGRISLQAVQETLKHSLVAVRHIHPGSSVTKKCELYLERLLGFVQGIHGQCLIHERASLMLSQPYLRNITPLMP